MGNETRLQRWELWMLVAILLSAAALRMVALTDVPPGLRYDELLNYGMAGRVLAGERPIYFTESWGHEPLFLYAQAAVMALTKECDWSLRLPAALGGLFGVLATWLAARRLFGPRVAMLTALALAVSFWSLLLSREGSRVIAVTPLFSLMVYFLWRGLGRSAKGHRGPAVDFLWAGLCLGSTVYVYVAGRVAPVLLIIFALYLALFRRRLFRRAWSGLLLCAVSGAMLAAPLVLLLYLNPHMEQRLGHLAGAWTALRGGDWAPARYLVLRALGMFVWQGERGWLYNVSGRPIFEPLAAACFLLGIVLCAWRWRQARCALLLLWLVVGISPAMVVPPSASFTHTIAAQPPAYILMAVGIEALWRAVSKRRGWMGPALAAVLVAWHGAASCHAYFVTWASAPQVRENYQGGVTAIARALDAHDPPGPVAIGAPFVDYWNPWNAVGFELALRRDDLSVRWFNPAGALVWPAGRQTVTYYFPVDPFEPQVWDPELEQIFMADATLLPADDDDFDAFRVDRAAALETRLAASANTPVVWPAEVVHLPPPGLPLGFDGRFALLGVELAGPTVSPNGELRLITVWEVLRADPTSVVAFVHLTADGYDIWGQQDWLDVRTEGLRPGDRFIQVHAVPVRSDTPPGLYHVELGLYGPDTLLRLPVETGTEDVVDRVWVGKARVE